MVRGTVEETLNKLLDKEADRITQAYRYERSEERRDTRAGHYTRKIPRAVQPYTEGRHWNTENRQTVFGQRGEYTGGRYAYHDATDALKVVLELLEND